MGPTPAAIDRLHEVACRAERDLFHALRGDAAVVAALDEARWRGLTEVALRTFSAPLLYGRLRQRRALGQLPEAVHGRLARVRAWSAGRWARSVEQVEELGDALEAHGVRCLVLKGAHVGLRYEVPGARATGDIDLLVGGDDLEAARRCMASLGYVAEAPEAWEDDHPDHRHLPPYIRVDGLPVEVHWTLGRRAEGASWAEGVWARAEPWGGGGAALGMEALDALLYACKHLAAHHLFNTTNGLAALADVERLVETEAFPPEEVARRAEAWGIRSSVALTLRLARDLLGAEVSAPMLAAVAVPGTDEVLPSAVWMLLHIGGFGASRHLQLPTAATLNPPHPVSGIRNGHPLRSAWAFGRGAALPPLDDLRLDHPRLGPTPLAWLGYPLHWGRLVVRHAGLVRLASPRVRAEIRSHKGAHLGRLRTYLEQAS